MFAQEKTCPACGKPFECGGLWFCWCRKVELDASGRNDLRERYEDCLCPSCLNRHRTATVTAAPDESA